jgi:hypothetical protein
MEHRRPARDREARFWRVRLVLELLKFGAWTVYQVTRELLS